MGCVRNHLDNREDDRYSVDLEYCGEPYRKHVARFCGEWIGQASSSKEAWELAQEHYDNHKICSVPGYGCGDCRKG